jgi:hypothetical protein
VDELPVSAPPAREGEGQGEGEGAGPPGDGGARRRRGMGSKTPAIIAATLVAIAAGYAASTLIGGSGGGGSTAGQPAAGARARALVAKDPMKAIVAGQLGDLRCAVSQAPPGGQVQERAECVPKTAGRPPIQGLTLTSFATRDDLNGLFGGSRALTRDPAVALSGSCGPDGPWGGQGRWFLDAQRTEPGGRMFCHTADQGGGGGRPTVVWTIDGARLLAQATASDSRDLGAWWVRTRNLRDPQR